MDTGMSNSSGVAGALGKNESFESCGFCSEDFSIRLNPRSPSPLLAFVLFTRNAASCLLTIVRPQLEEKSADRPFLSPLVHRSRSLLFMIRSRCIPAVPKSLLSSVVLSMSSVPSTSRGALSYSNRVRDATRVPKLSSLPRPGQCIFRLFSAHSLQRSRGP